MSVDTARARRPGTDVARRRRARILETVLTQRIVLLAVLIVIVVGVADVHERQRLPHRRLRLRLHVGHPHRRRPAGAAGLRRTRRDRVRPRRYRPVRRRHGVAGRDDLRVRLRQVGLAAVGRGAAGHRSSARCSAAINGFLVARIGFPALIATLATYYAYKSIALVINDQKPINSARSRTSTRSPVRCAFPIIGDYIPDVPLGVFTFLLPVLVVLWLALDRGTFGRRLYGIGTNDVAARWAGLDVAGTRMRAYILSGALSGLVAIYVTAEFASARPDAGTSGNGLALPAITIAVLGGVAITGGVGRLAGVLLATVLIVWLNAGIILYFEGNAGTPVPTAGARRRPHHRRAAQRSDQPKVPRRR